MISVGAIEGGAVGSLLGGGVRWWVMLIMGLCFVSAANAVGNATSAAWFRGQLLGDMLPYGSEGLVAANIWGRMVLPRPIRCLECEFSPGGRLECEFSPGGIKPLLSLSLLSHQELSCWSQQPGGLWYPWPAESISSLHVAGDMQPSMAPSSLSSSRYHLGSRAWLPARA